MDAVFNHWQGFLVGEDKPSEEEIITKSQKQKPDFRSIALSIAIECVAKATLMRGIWP